MTQEISIDDAAKHINETKDHILSLIEKGELDYNDESQRVYASDLAVTVARREHDATREKQEIAHYAKNEIKQETEACGIKSAAKQIGISTRLLAKLARKGIIASRKSQGKRLLFYTADLEEFSDRQKLNIARNRQVAETDKAVGLLDGIMRAIFLQRTAEGVR